MYLDLDLDIELALELALLLALELAVELALELALELAQLGHQLVLCTKHRCDHPVCTTTGQSFPSHYRT